MTPYTQTTDGITVSVKPQYLEDRSDPDRALFAFSYKVTIENQSAETIQLINRHWQVFSNEIQIADVKGEGVVGEQPVLEPGVVYQYSSMSIIEDPAGHMQGSFTFRSETGAFFDAVVPRFELVHIEAGALH